MIGRRLERALYLLFSATSLLWLAMLGPAILFELGLVARDWAGAGLMVMLTILLLPVVVTAVATVVMSAILLVRGTAEVRKRIGLWFVLIVAAVAAVQDFNRATAVRAAIGALVLCCGVVLPIFWRRACGKA